MTTDKADKVHPVVEAMARAVLAKRTGIPDCYDNMRSWAEETDEALEIRCKKRDYDVGSRETQIDNRDCIRRDLAALYEEAKAAAKVLIEECAKIVERGMGFHTQVDEILESAATAIRALSSEMGREGLVDGGSVKKHLREIISALEALGCTVEADTTPGGAFGGIAAKLLRINRVNPMRYALS